MRRFIVIGHNAITSGDFSLNDLSGATGRLDVLLRCINSALFLSNDLRRDTEINLVLLGPPNPPKTITLMGSDLKRLNPDERSTAAVIKEVLKKPIFGKYVKSGPGIYVSRLNFRDIIAGIKDSEIIALKEDGTDIRKILFAPPVTFVLSDNQDFSSDEIKILKDAGAHFVSIGPKSLLASHCITIVHNEMDRKGV